MLLGILNCVLVLSLHAVVYRAISPVGASQAVQGRAVHMKRCGKHIKFTFVIDAKEVLLKTLSGSDGKTSNTSTTVIINRF